MIERGCHFGRPLPNQIAVRARPNFTMRSSIVVVVEPVAPGADPIFARADADGRRHFDCVVCVEKVICAICAARAASITLMTD